MIQAGSDFFQDPAGRERVNQTCLANFLAILKKSTCGLFSSLRPKAWGPKHRGNHEELWLDGESR